MNNKTNMLCPTIP